MAAALPILMASPETMAAAGPILGGLTGAAGAGAGAAGAGAGALSGPAAQALSIGKQQFAAGMPSASMEATKAMSIGNQQASAMNPSFFDKIKSGYEQASPYIEKGQKAMEFLDSMKNPEVGPLPDNSVKIAPMQKMVQYQRNQMNPNDLINILRSSSR